MLSNDRRKIRRHFEIACINSLAGRLQLVAVVDCLGNDADVYTRQFLEISNKPLRVLAENVDSGTTDAVPMVKKLSFNNRRFINVKPLKKVGIVPINELEESSSLRRDVREPNVLGMLPVSLLSPMVICSIMEREPKLDGMGPTREFFSR